MRFFTKTARILCAGITGIILMTWLLPAFSLSASARTEQKLIGYRGDVNQDSTVDLTDALLLQSILLTEGEQPKPDALCFSDLNKDEGVDARDLTILKRVVETHAEPEPVYQETEIPDPVPVPAPIRALAPALPSTGARKILLVSVDFPDCSDEQEYSAEQIKEIAFGPADPSSRFYPLESITAYYGRASYGRLHLTGDVYKYTANAGVDVYAEHPEYLIGEIMYALDPTVNYQEYDSDRNLILDTLLVHLPAAANPEMNVESPWWPCSYKPFVMGFFDRLRVGNVCIGSWDLSDQAGFVSTWTHELGHAMGLPDYYYYVNPIGDGDGLPGEAGMVMMDDALGDLTAFDKLMVGWYAAGEVQFYSGGTMTFTIPSSQHAPGCIMIPKGDAFGALSEYFLVEYVTADENNRFGTFGGIMAPFMQHEGVRVLHCDAEVTFEEWGPEFKWGNYSSHYDSSNLKQRVLRLVSSKRSGFFEEGRTIDASREHFGWYGEDGFDTVDPGVTIRVDRIADGMCTVTVSDGKAA